MKVLLMPAIRGAMVRDRLSLQTTGGSEKMMRRVAFSVCLVLVCGCTSDPPQTAAQTVTSAPVPSQAAPTVSKAVPAANLAPEKTARPSLGSGYQDLKWGTSKKTVRAQFKGKGTMPDYMDSKDELGVRLRDGTSIDFSFFHDKLYTVIFHPNFGDAERDRPALLKAMQAKYGAGTPVDGMVDGLGIPLGIVRWSDGEMQIDVRWYPNPPTGISSGGQVVYQNVLVAKQRDEERAAAEAAKAKQAQDEVNRHL